MNVKNSLTLASKMFKLGKLLRLSCALTVISILVLFMFKRDFHIQEIFTESGIRYEKQKIDVDYTEVLERLLDVYHQLDTAHKAKEPPRTIVLEDLEYAAAKLYPPVNIDIHNPLKNLSRIKSMHDSGTGNRSALPLKNLVTVLVQARRENDVIENSKILQVIKDFHSTCPEIHVCVIGSELSYAELSNTPGLDADQISLVATTNALPGVSWNEAIRLVKTPMVFIARDIAGFAQRSSLEKVTRVLKEMPGVGAVGGALQRNSNRRVVGCYQSYLKNYVLRYHEGHQFSRNECIFCDYIDGQFVTYTQLLKGISLDEHLHSNVLFQDFFLQLSKDWYSVICTDITFRGSGPMTDEDSILPSDSWLNFARKWELNRIALDLQTINVLQKYSCIDIGISCGSKIRQTNYYSTPICCQEDFAKALDFFSRFCTTHNISHQFDSGTCLGAVKMADIMPWDRDADGSYIEADYLLIKNASRLFRKHGFQLGNFQDPACCDNYAPNNLKTSYLQVFVSGMDIEMWGEWKLSFDPFIQARSFQDVDTKMEIHGVWVNGPPNPGYYARKRYGTECLRHAQSWVLTGKKSSWEPYNAGYFIKCRSRWHHSCLDTFSPDGSIAFMVPE